jgi:uncharacterized protein (TIRG00374 family)
LKRIKIFKLNWVRSILAVVVSAVILIFLFHKIDIKAASTIIRGSDLRLILLAVLLSLSINIFIGALKWKMILRRMNCELSFREALSIRAACAPFKVVFPLKSSELLKAFYLNKKKGMPFGRAVSSLLVEKALNILVTLCIFLVGLGLVDLKIPWIVPASLTLTVLLILFSKKAREGFINLVGRIHPKLHDFTTELLHGFEVIGPKKMASLLFYSLLFQSSEFINTYILFKAVGVNLPFSLIMVYIPLIMVINNLPITVLGLGTREALLVFLFAQYGASSSLLSGGILVSFVEYILPLLAGLFFMRLFLEYTAIERDVASESGV